MTIDAHIIQGRSAAQRLTRAQREVLMDHVDGSCPIVVHHNLRHQSVLALARYGMIILNGPRSRITDFGRATLAALLAQYAEYLAKAARGREARHYAVAPWLDELTKSLDTIAPNNGAPQ